MAAARTAQKLSGNAQKRSSTKTAVGSTGVGRSAGSSSTSGLSDIFTRERALDTALRSPHPGDPARTLDIARKYYDFLAGK